MDINEYYKIKKISKLITDDKFYDLGHFFYF